MGRIYQRTIIRLIPEVKIGVQVLTGYSQEIFTSIEYMINMVMTIVIATVMTDSHITLRFITR